MPQLRDEQGGCGNLLLVSWALVHDEWSFALIVMATGVGFMSDEQGWKRAIGSAVFVSGAALCAVLCRR